MSAMKIAAIVSGAVSLVLLAQLLWWRWKERKPKQTTWCYCPGCKKDLVSRARDKAAAEVGDVKFWDDDLKLFVHYQCPCGTWSAWDFDSAPVPIICWAEFPDGHKEMREQLLKRYR